MADRRAERDEAAQRDAVAGAVAADHHLLGPRADVAAHELARVLESAAAEDHRLCGRGRRGCPARPRHRPAAVARVPRSRRAPRRGSPRPGVARRSQQVCPRPARAGAADRHQPPAAHAVLQAAHGGVERQAVRSSHVPGRLDLVDEHAAAARGFRAGSSGARARNVAGAHINPPLIAIDPPKAGSLSSTRTSAPASAAASAAESPAMPPPMMITPRGSPTSQLLSTAHRSFDCPELD